MVGSLKCLHLVCPLQLDDVSLHGMTNQEVLEVMKQTGQTVVLTLLRKKARGLERSLDKGRETEPTDQPGRGWFCWF